MDIFEEQFKTRAQGTQADLPKIKRASQKAPSKTSLIDSNKAKNLAITLRKGGLSPSGICTAIETYVHHGISYLLLTFPSHALTGVPLYHSCAQVQPAGIVPRLLGAARALHSIRF